jgi:alpha-glucosidase
LADTEPVHPDHWNLDPHAVLVSDGIARFRHPIEPGDAPVPPSPAVTAPTTVLGPAPDDFRTRPRFAVRDARRLVKVELEPGTSVYGTGEVPGRLHRRGSRVVTWNTDQWCYDEADESLYQSHPWVLGVRSDGSAFGVLLDSCRRLTIELNDSIHVASDAGVPPFHVYVIERDAPAQVVAALSFLTGRMPMPPRWALGYQQCRWSYEPDARVRQVADGFRARGIPCDVLWLDIDYMDGFRCFTFDPHKFPDPAGLNEHLHARGFKSVWMIDCGIKVEPEYAVYRSGHEGGHFLLDRHGAEYHGTVWPGPCAFPDFTRSETRQWWAGLYRDFLAHGIDGVWNDMNEPSVQDNPGKQVPEDLRHRADPELGGPGPHTAYHNVYGMLMARATREGILAAKPDRRPFVLTRSNFIGGHRYAATWTGDNRSSWEHLGWSIPMVLNLGLSGQPFSGPDIGGFADNATPELFARWMGIGSLLPFARGHSIKDSVDHEPWSFGAACERACRLALERRYRLLPYLYTLFHEAATAGLPIARPLFFADPRDPALREADDSFLLGPDLLVRCRVTPEGPCRSPIPRGLGAWRAAELVGGSWTVNADTHLPELLVRIGAILPLGPVMQFTEEKPLDPLTLLVSPDSEGTARGQLYEDAGDGHEHQHGVWRITTYHCHREGDHLVVHSAPPLGRFHAYADRAVEVVALLPRGIVRFAAGREGKSIRVALHADDLRE